MTRHRPLRFALRSLPRTALLFALCALLFAAAYAQSATATLSGTVEDQNGAIVPGAAVTLVNRATGLQRETMTNDQGSFTIPLLQPSTYSLTVRREGFAPAQIQNVLLNVGDQKALQIQLKAGDINATVQVINDAPLINTESAAVSTVVDRNFAENIPLNGRSFQTLIQLTPGVVLTTNNNSVDIGQFSVNGQRASSNYWTVDGVSANVGLGTNSPTSNGLAGSVGSFSALGTTNSLVSVDALQEFRIQTSTFAPEFGRTPGGQISIVTRSGTNQFHGTAFDYLRNDVFDSNDWFADSARLRKPEERQNDLGGTFSGPILHDRNFFFFSYEGLRLRLPGVLLTTVPDASARQNASPPMQPFLNAFPLPNGPDNVSTGIAQFNASFSNRSSLDAYSLRIDHKLRDKLTLMGRYNYSPSDIVQRGGTFSVNTLSSSNITTQTGTLGATWAVSPWASEDLRFNYSIVDSFSHNDLDNLGGAVPLSVLPLPSPFSKQNAKFILDIRFLVNGVLGEGQGPRNEQRQVNIVDAFSAQKGSHSLKFGIDFRRLSPSRVNSSYQQEADFLAVSSAEAGKPLFF